MRLRHALASVSVVCPWVVPCVAPSRVHWNLAATLSAVLLLTTIAVALFSWVRVLVLEWIDSGCPTTRAQWFERVPQRDPGRVRHAVLGDASSWHRRLLDGRG